MLKKQAESADKKMERICLDGKMTEFNSIQQKTIADFREKHGYGLVVPDEEIVSIMMQEMELSGEVYAGFEHLAKKPQKKPESVPTPLVPQPQRNTIFSFGPAAYTPTPTPSPKRELNGFQQQAVNYLGQMINNAQNTLNMQDLREGYVSIAKLWGGIKNTFNTTYSRDSVDAAVSDTKSDIARLVMAGQGQLVDANGNEIDFAAEFKRVRGVEYSEENIQKCEEASKQMAQVDVCKKSIEALKSKLKALNTGTVSARMDTKSTKQALLEIFQLLCPNDEGGIDATAVNELLASIEKSNPNDGALRYGTGMRLAKVNGEYEFIVTNQSSSKAPFSTEHLRLLETTLTTALDKAYAGAIGVEFDDSTSIEEIRKLSDEKYAEYQKDYEATFAQAYGEDNLKLLAAEYVEGQQTADMVGDMTINIISMATMFVGSGMLLQGVKGGVKGLNLVSKTSKGTQLIERTKLFTDAVRSSKAMGLLPVVQVTQPLQGLRTVTSEATLTSLKSLMTENLLGEELTEEEKLAREVALDQLGSYGLSVTEGAAWMILGMASGAVGDKARLFLKQKGLVGVVKNSGKTLDEIMEIYKSGHMPKELAATFAKIEAIATASGNSLEFAADIMLTAGATKALHGTDLTMNDVLMSINGVLIGAAMQKQNLAKSAEVRLKEYKDLLQKDNPNIKPDELEIKAKTLLELSELAKSKIDLTPTRVNKTSVVESLQYTESNIRKLVAKNPELRNNPEILNKLDEWFSVANRTYHEPIKKLGEKISKPLLANHRLEIIHTVLSDPTLYKNKTILNSLDTVWRAENAAEAKNFVNGLKMYSEFEKQYPPEDCANNEHVQNVLSKLLINTTLSPENKSKILKSMIEHKEKQVDYEFDSEFYLRLSDEDDVDFMLEVKNTAPRELVYNTYNTFGINGYYKEGDIASRKEAAELRKKLYRELKDNPEVPASNLARYLINTDNTTYDIIKKYAMDDRFYFDLTRIVQTVTKENKDFVLELMGDKNFDVEDISEILVYTNKNNVDFVRDELYKNENFPNSEIAKTAAGVQGYTLALAKQLVGDESFPNTAIHLLLNKVTPETMVFARKLYADKNISRCDIAHIIDYPKQETIQARIDVYNYLNNKPDFPKEYIGDVLKAIDKDTAANKDYAIKLCNEFSKMEIPAEKLYILIQNYEKIKPGDMKKLIKKLGQPTVLKLSDSDLTIACQMVDICKINNINEIPQSGKKELLRRLVKCNEGLFKISPELKKLFPLIPTNKENYCSLLPQIVRSLGIETNVLKPEEVNVFNHSMSDLAGSLAKVSDKDFANLKITQEFAKDDFIKVVLEKTKNLSSAERQKVYDYFGFELHYNKTNPTQFTISGYPVNLNNGKKLAQITNPKTKEVVEALRPDVIRFSEQNPIKCNNPEVEKFLNEVVDALPELRVQIGKPQHATHSFDVLQHSLKVMQKISQDPKYQTLPEEDKKLMLLASLLHDITKREGSVDKTHANESGFDAFYIAKKFGLSRDQEIKLYTLIKHHEWLEYVNTAKNEAQLTKRLQSIAYDLQNDNLFDMALIFTHADLKAVKADDTFHDTKEGNSRITVDGTRRSFGASADVYATRIKAYVEELQKSQPLLPVTKFPTASRIEQSITIVNADGSTNIKGVYKDKNGLVVIKFNEVEDWEAIGFPKGSCSKGISAKGLNTCGEECDVDTGNIKFFAHALVYESQLIKFDAFSLPDSDALLSISYAERPESKYRFFRTQGVLLEFETKYIHGGGNTDAGSGYGKNIDEFKENYIFGGEREDERLYVSNLIKEATGMNDAEYVQFVKANQNKAFSEITPADIRDKIIKALATINSNVRKGNREYNEMYGSNPNPPMAVFAYSTEIGDVGNPIEFLNMVNNRTDFLKRYALEHNIPFVVFGD